MKSSFNTSSERQPVRALALVFIAAFAAICITPAFAQSRPMGGPSMTATDTLILSAPVKFQSMDNYYRDRFTMVSRWSNPSTGSFTIVTNFNAGGNYLSSNFPNSWAYPGDMSANRGNGRRVDISGLPHQALPMDSIQLGGVNGPVYIATWYEGEFVSLDGLNFQRYSPNRPIASRYTQWNGTLFSATSRGIYADKPNGKISRIWGDDKEPRLMSICRDLQYDPTNQQFYFSASIERGYNPISLNDRGQWVDHSHLLWRSGDGQYNVMSAYRYQTFRIGRGMTYWRIDETPDHYNANGEGYGSKMSLAKSEDLGTSWDSVSLPFEPQGMETTDYGLVVWGENDWGEKEGRSFVSLYNDLTNTWSTTEFQRYPNGYMPYVSRLWYSGSYEGRVYSVPGGLVVNSEGDSSFFIAVSYEPEPVPELFGDVNRDGSVTVSDATAALKIALGQKFNPAWRPDLGDFNASGQLDMDDVQTIIRIVTGIYPASLLYYQ